MQSQLQLSILNMARAWGGILRTRKATDGQSVVRHVDKAAMYECGSPVLIVVGELLTLQAVIHLEIMQVRTVGTVATCRGKAATSSQIFG